MSIFLLLSLACVDPTEVEEENPEELITTVILEAEGPEGQVSAQWEDLEASGQPTIETLSLIAGVDYTLRVRFLNALEDPAEEITDEVLAEGVDHQVFFTGPAVQGPANPDNAEALVQVEYADQDTNDQPVGLENDLSALMEGLDDMTVTLRHMPPEGGEAVKTDSLAQDLAAGAWSDLPGDNDAQVVFPVQVIAP